MKGDVPIPKKSISTQLKNALAKLAFGKTNDIVKLVLSDESSSPLLNINRLDLFAISELKRPKGGGVEVKLVNRLDAIRLLFDIDSASDNNGDVQNFLSALANPHNQYSSPDTIKEQNNEV